MSETSARRKVTAKELLDIREGEWRPRADAVSLAAEALDEIPVRHREQALEVLGALHAAAPAGPAAERLLRRWPAVQVLATAGVAAEHYAKGTFWPKLIDILKIEPNQNFQKFWGEAFLENLEELDLPTFEHVEDTGSKYVGRILLHSGMPTYCLQDFFKILSRKRSSGLTPEAFVSWAASDSAESALFDTDKPVRRFLRFGGEFAIDVADRSYEVLDVVRAGGSADDGLLPKRFWSEAERFIESGNDPGGAAGPTGSGTSNRPRLVLDPFGQGLLIRLPPVGDAPDGKAVWVVALGEDVQRVATHSLWPGSSEPAPQTDVAIGRPVRTASVALAGSEHLQFPMMVVDDQNPLLAFGDDGELIASSLPLPAARVWMLFPGEPPIIKATGAVEVVTETPLPPGWSGFCLVQVDLSDATAVSIHGATRTVRKFESATITMGDPVHGVRVASGAPVFAELPRVNLPNGMINADWDVALLDGDGTVISRQRITGGDDPNRMWEGLPRPLVGTYSLRVRGPWGRGATRTFSIVEGLSLSFAPTWRRFITGGLQPCVVKVNAADGVGLAQTQITFGERDREHSLRVSANSKCSSLIIAPPHMSVAYQSIGTSLGPSVRPLSLTREDITEQLGELILDVGAAAEPTLHVIAGSRVVQTVRNRLGRAGIYRFDLAQIIDTLRNHPQAALALSPEGELVIATVRPQSLFRGIHLEGNELRFDACVDVDGLTAYVFALRAPWRSPASLPITDGRAQLPEWLVEAGPLGVVARIEDPWVPLPPPGWAQAGSSTLVDAEGWVVGDNPEEAAISKFLAGHAPLPAEITDLTRLWNARALLGRLGLGSRIDDVAKGIDHVIYSHPAAALGALAASDVPVSFIPALMVRSGLAWADLADAHEGTAPSWTARGALPAALLSAADSVWSADEVEAAMSVCGDAVNGLLDGQDPHASAGCLDESADLLDREPGFRDGLIRAAGLIPHGLLSADSRVLAAMEFVENRRHQKLDWLNRNARSVLREAENLIKLIGDPRTSNAFRARMHRTHISDWYVVPSLSMAFALAARHAARGHREAMRWVLREQRPWESLAEVAPQLVTIDLIIAELTVGRRAEVTMEEDDDEQS